AGGPEGDTRQPDPRALRARLGARDVRRRARRPPRPGTGAGAGGARLSDLRPALDDLRRSGSLVLLRGGGHPRRARRRAPLVRPFLLPSILWRRALTPRRRRRWVPCSARRWTSTCATTGPSAASPPISSVP